jgi:hypothetical protein
MATFTLDANYEVVEEITSETIEKIRLLALPGTLKSRSVKYRHPRFKNRFSPTNFMVSFRLDGMLQSQCESSMEALDRALTETYLALSQ